MIDDDAWLGFGAIVLMGYLNWQAVVQVPSSHDVPDGVIVVGAPARVVNMRSKKQGARLILLELNVLNRVIENNCATEVLAADEI